MGYLEWSDFIETSSRMVAARGWGREWGEVQWVWVVILPEVQWVWVAILPDGKPWRLVVQQREHT